MEGGQGAAVRPKEESVGPRGRGRVGDVGVVLGCVLGRPAVKSLQQEKVRMEGGQHQ